MSTSTTEVGLAGIEGVAATREACRHAVDIEIVAFPQSGLVSRPGTLELMESALANDADVVGGLDPCGIDRDPKGQLDAIFRLADTYGKPIDIHLHEPDELGAFSIEMIVERTRALGLQGRVVVSHAFCLGMADRARAQGLVELLAREEDCGGHGRHGVAAGAGRRRAARGGRHAVRRLRWYPRFLGPLWQRRHAGARHAARPAEQLPHRRRRGVRAVGLVPTAARRRPASRATVWRSAAMAIWFWSTARRPPRR